MQGRFVLMWPPAWVSRTVCQCDYTNTMKKGAATDGMNYTKTGLNCVLNSFVDIEGLGHVSFLFDCILLE